MRKELRQLSNAEREKVFAALDIMKTTRQEDGLKRYGANFVNYDLVVLAHVRAATHPTCDQGHNGPAFLTFHRALSVWVEKSLVAIDPEIHGLPYWDYNLDFDNNSNPREAIMWSDDWFGEANGDERDMNMIRTGRFKHWQVHDNATALFAEFPVHHDASVQTPDILQSYNFLRGPTNLQYAPRITRKDTTCGKDSSAGAPIPGTFVTKKHWPNCVDADASLVDFFVCMDHGPHGFYHAWLGGAWGASDGSCHVKQGSSSLADVVTGCMVCPTCERGHPCRCHRNETACLLQNRTETCRKLPIDPELCESCGHACADGELGANGDPWDGASSANDPSFIFHHVNVDRMFAEWQLRWRSSKPFPFSGFPKTGMCQGHKLNDVVSDRFPFLGSLLGWSGADAVRRLTNADILEATVPNKNAFYVYDVLKYH